MRDPVRFELRSLFSPNEKDDDVAHESLFSRSSFLSCFLAFSLWRGVVVCLCSCLLFVVALAFPSWFPPTHPGAGGWAFLGSPRGAFLGSPRGCLVSGVGIVWVGRWR